VTAVLALALCVLFNVPSVGPNAEDAPGDIVFAGFADPVIFLFIGPFVLAQAMITRARPEVRVPRALAARGGTLDLRRDNRLRRDRRLDKRVHLQHDDRCHASADRARDDGGPRRDGERSVGHRQGREPLAFRDSPYAHDLLRRRRRGLLTPIGTPPNLIGIGFIEEETGIRISFFDWVLTAFPIVLLMFIALCTILILLNRPEVRRISGAEEYIAEERSKLGRFSTGERNTLIAFAVAVTLWVLPGLTALVFGDESTVYSFLYSRLDEGTVAIIGAALLFILPINWAERRFTMNWNQAARIDWGTIILFGSGIALGTLLSDTGLAETIGTGVADALGFSSLLAVSAVSALIAILISETTSNTASATIVVPIVIPIASAAGLDPLIPALAAVFGASFGFMMPAARRRTPSSTAPA